ncbi:hypothetical protein [Winogradskyella luteola]|uniref:Uncharacterized protein n=1 Tax=Winogradskyella luteola TaxID=2828330 RepID=A0A9X1JMU6_9FLAO|nr:hypothetical protein [Winogradskyella luteola]MBV7268840.1 hypothetical protein [Winogradskyella luteola]
MKNLTFFIIFITSISFSQTQEATLHFYDGESISGYGSIFQGHKIKFRVSLEDEPDVWTGLIVSGITFHGFEYDIKFGYLYVKNHKRHPLLLEVLTEGEVTLYASVNRKIFFQPTNDDGIIPQSTVSFPTVKYYVKRDDEELGTKLKGRFKKCIIAYFGECSGIIKGIDNHEFRWATMIDLVNYYNDFCVD